MKKHIIYTDDICKPEEAGEIWDDELEQERPCKDWDEANFILESNASIEKDNLNIDAGGVIVGFADLGLWNGHRQGGKVFGDTANSIFDYCEDNNEWYADRYNIRGTFHHHDGTNSVLFRVARNREHAEYLVERIAYHGMTEEQFRKATKSLRPVVAKVYGW